MKRIICITALLIGTLAAFAQQTKIPQRLELVEIEINDGQFNLEVFNMPKDGENSYFLSVSRLGIGDDFVQLKIDPVSELFVPLGETLEETVETLQFMQRLFKADPGTAIEMDGCVGIGFPSDKLETVRVTHRQLVLSHLLEFSISRGNYVRAAHVPRSDFNSLITSLGVYRKLHPNEE